MENKKFLLIKTNEGVFVSDVLNSWSSTQIRNLRFNKQLAEETFHKNWFKIEYTKDTLVEEIIPAKTETVKYKLIKGFPVTDKTPKEVPGNFFEYNYDIESVENAGIKDLYEPVVKETPETYDPVDAEFEVIAEIENLEVLKPLNLKGYFRNSTGPDGERAVSDNPNWKEVNHQFIDRIIFHNDLLPLRPVEISSEASYAILRQYIKSNLNYEVCEITSDYDFCLTVSKKIKLKESKAYRYNENMFSGKRKPKFVTRFIKENKVKVFEIAPNIKGEVYEGYTEMPTFQGDNYRDLEKKVEGYCKEVIEELNKPVHYCEKCNGLGVIEKEISFPVE